MLMLVSGFQATTLWDACVNKHTTIVTQELPHVQVQHHASQVQDAKLTLTRSGVTVLAVKVKKKQRPYPLQSRQQGGPLEDVLYALHAAVCNASVRSKVPACV